MRENYNILNVEEIDFDIDNPRIKMTLMHLGRMCVDWKERSKG